MGSIPSMYLSYFLRYLSLFILWSNLANSSIRLPSSTTQPYLSFTILAIRDTYSTGHFQFLSLIMLEIKEVMLLPARGICLRQLLMTKPSTTGIIWVTPSPESNTVPVQLIFSEMPDDEISASTAWTPMYRPLTLKVSNMISATFSLFSGGLRGGSVRITTVSSGSHRRQSNKLRCQNFSMRSQFLTMPPSIGFTTLWVLYKLRASSPMQKSNVSHTFLLLLTNWPAGFWLPVSAIRVGMSKAGAVLPAQPILVQPVPLSITTILLSKFMDGYLSNYQHTCNKLYSRRYNHSSSQITAQKSVEWSHSISIVLICSISSDMSGSQSSQYASCMGFTFSTRVFIFLIIFSVCLPFSSACFY